MHYLGGKYRVADKIAALISTYTPEIYVEPFCGSAWVADKVDARRVILADACWPLISLYRSLKGGWVPPSEVTEAEYEHLRRLRDPADPLTAFAGFGCSFSGRYFEGYARSGTRNYAMNAKNSLLRKRSLWLRAELVVADYRALRPRGAVIYCDPPYDGTKGFSGTARWESILFWEVVRRWSKENTVLVSEYSAPPDFQCVLEIPTKTDMRMGSGLKEQRVERVFTL